MTIVIIAEKRTTKRTKDSTKYTKLRFEYYSFVIFVKALRDLCGKIQCTFDFHKLLLHLRGSFGFTASRRIHPG
jgi:hypothetical protein